jgi:MoaA/NifB/PqqE/SkfB family radical SAM enzyme
LNVSVDGPADVHDRIRGVPNGFKRTTEAISLLQRRKSELGLETPRICVNCVISPNNVDLLADMVSIVREVGADSLTFQHLMFTAEEYEKNERIDVERLLDAIDKVEVAKNGMPASFFPRVGEDNISPYYADLSHDFGDFCITPWYRFDIFPNGDVGVCRKVFSNIRQGQTLRTIWNGKPFRGFRKSLVKRGLYLPHCLRCCHRQYG